MNILMLFLGLISLTLALITIFVIIVKPLYEAKRSLLSYVVLTLVYLAIKFKVKVERFQELRRKLIEASKMREEARE